MDSTTRDIVHVYISNSKLESLISLSRNYGYSPKNMKAFRVLKLGAE